MFILTKYFTMGKEPSSEVKIKEGWFCTLLHDHPEAEGIVMFDEAPEKGQLFLLPSSGYKKTWQVHSVSPSDMSFTAVEPDKGCPFDETVQAPEATPTPPGSGWSPNRPDSVGLWWFYGAISVGGGLGPVYPHNDLLYDRHNALTAVEVHRTGMKGGNGQLRGTYAGAMVPLVPYVPGNRRPGYIGVWKKAEVPALPEVRPYMVTTKEIHIQVPACNPILLRAGSPLEPSEKHGLWQVLRSWKGHPFALRKSDGILDTLDLTTHEFQASEPVPAPHA